MLFKFSILHIELIVNDFQTKKKINKRMMTKAKMKRMFVITFATFSEPLRSCAVGDDILFVADPFFANAGYCFCFKSSSGGVSKLLSLRECLIPIFCLLF